MESGLFSIHLFGQVARRISALIILLFSAISAYAQYGEEQIVQINGVTMTADSLRGVAGATVLVKNKNRGVYSSDRGVFSIVCLKGDTLQFSALGYRPTEYVIPADIKGQYFSMIQLMTQDTFYLPETIVRPLPSRESFNYAFQHWRIPDDKLEIARKNTDQQTLRAIAYVMPHDGRENQSAYQHQAATDAVYYGQIKPSNIMNPLAWAEFFDAWKRGDFRKKY